MLSQELQALIDKARSVQMTPEQQEEQRISFAFGNVSFENASVTREAVKRASETLKDRSDEQAKCPGG